MKFSLAFLVALALSGAVNVRSTPLRHTNELFEVFQEFVDLVPKEEVSAIFLQYLENDVEVQAVVEYVRTDEFKSLVRKVESIEDVINFYNYLQESGLDIYGLVNSMHEKIGLPPLVPGGSARNVKITGGVAGLIFDIKFILPLKDIKALYHEKLETSPAFAQLVERLRTPRFQELIDTLRVNEEFQKIHQFAKGHGVDVKAITDLLATMFGLEFGSNHNRSTQDLHVDLMDFLALVPVEELKKIVSQYLEEDAEVQAVVEYVRTDEFKSLVRKVESIEDVINFYNYLQESGLDIYGLVNSIHEKIGLPHLVPGGSARNVRITGGVAGLIFDIKFILPLKDIKALYHEKLENSPAFAQLVERLRTPRFQELIDTLRVNEEFQKIHQFAKGHGVDVKAVTDLLATMFGLEFGSNHSRSTPDLHVDLMDFLALVPVVELKKIVSQYLEEDAEVQAVVEYVQTDEFKSLVRKVESIEDVINFYNYLQESGLDIYGLVNSIHEKIGLPHLVPGGSARNVRITGGVAGLIFDIKFILPLKDIKALYHEKLENSPAFAQLVERLRTPRFQELIDTLRVNEEFQKIHQFAKGHGVDVKAVTDLLATMFGLKFPNRHAQTVMASLARGDLNDDLQDFVALLPIEEITDIVLDYLTNDKEIHETIEYLRSANFRKVVEEFEATKEAKNVVAFLEESGLDAYAFFNIIHEILGIPPFHPYALSNKRTFAATGGFTGLIADIKAILPVEEIKALYYYKIENSSSFIKLVKRLNSPKFQEFIHSVLAKEEIHVVFETLKGHGIDLQAIADLVSEVLGLHSPRRVVRVDRALDSNNEELQKDLAEFIALLPVAEIVDVAIDYVMNDPDVQVAAAYVKSSKFRELATPAQQNREFRRFLDYLDRSGLPASTTMNKINAFLGLPEVVPSSLKRTKRAGGGVRGMLDAIESLLPREEIKALFEYKKLNSNAFKYMMKRLQAQEFQGVVNDLTKNEDFRIFGFTAGSYGIDLDRITGFFEKVIGVEDHDEMRYRLQSFARSLDADLHEFVALVPARKIRLIVARYYLLDKEFKAAIVYAKSNEFAQLIRDLHEISEYNELLNSLEEAGLDVQTYIAKAHKFIGFTEFRFSSQERKTNGMAGFIAEIKATLPVADIKALYKHKLETSEDFAGFVELIKSDKFQTLTDVLFANKIFQDILHRAQAHGVDLNAVSDFFLAVFGITTPPGVINFFAWL